jgi:hypothetical protein
MDQNVANRYRAEAGNLLRNDQIDFAEFFNWFMNTKLVGTRQ